jgi:hypothetical protein
MDAPNIWTHRQAPRAALKLCQMQQAFHFLAASKEEYGGVVLGEVLREAIQTEFDAAWEKAGAAIGGVSFRHEAR